MSGIWSCSFNRAHQLTRVLYINIVMHLLLVLIITNLHRVATTVIAPGNYCSPVGLYIFPNYCVIAYIKILSLMRIVCISTHGILISNACTINWFNIHFYSKIRLLYTNPQLPNDVKNLSLSFMSQTVVFRKKNNL